MPSALRIMISAGDYSADIHGEALVKELKKINPSVWITALGGIKLKSVANEFLQDMVGLDVSGFSQPIKQFFILKRILQNDIFPQLASRKIHAVVLIDYYGFNIHIAEKAKEHQIPVFYFVSPQVWASRKHRIHKLKKFVTRMLVIFPFEEELYRENGVPATFVGHPLIDSLPQTAEKKDYKNLTPNSPIQLGLMPGSRQRELFYHMPIMLQCYKELKKEFTQLKATLFAVDSIPDDYYRSFMDPQTAEVSIVRGNLRSKRLELNLSLTASGTATLENALLGIPMIVIYRTSWLTYAIAKRIIRVPYISMPNLLADRTIVPELIQDQANAKAVAQTAGQLLKNSDLVEKMVKELIQLKDKLGSPGAYQRTAKIILQSIQPI